jgi:rhodanese-related sulfurtransferase
MVRQLAVIALGASTLLLGCRSSQTQATGTSTSSEPTQTSIKETTVAEVAELVKNRSATIVDANGSDTRQDYGVIPGAVLLTNHREYALTELPPSKKSKLVFYCGGTMCRASDTAAARATSAGYPDVSVLRAGIKGWRAAGLPTETPRS